MVRRLVLLLLVLLSAAASAQAPPRLSVTVRPDSVPLGEAATLSVVVEASEKPPQPRVPVGEDFVLVPVSYTEASTSVNGRVTFQAVYGFELRPTREGTIQVPPFEVEVGGATYRSEPVRITVTEGAALPIPQEEPPLLVTAEVDRREVWVGEPLLWRFQFLRRVNLLAAPEYRPPSTPGFLAVQRPQREVTTWRGDTEYVGAEVRLLLFPQTAGAAKIGAASAKLSPGAFNPYDLASDREFFSRLFSGAGQGILATEAFEVRVKPLPTQGRPPEFRGAVGDFRAEASLDRAHARVGEPVTLEVRISGEGNLGLLDPPALPPLPGFRVHDTKSEGGLDPDGDRPTGTRTFRTVIEPRTPGEHRLGAMKFAWFDPAAGRYRTQTIPGLRLDVTGEALPEASPRPAAVPKPPGLREPHLPPSLWPPVRPQGPWVLLPTLLALALVLGWRAPRPRVLRGAEAARAGLAAGKAPAAVLGAWLQERLGPQAAALSREELRRALRLPDESWRELSRLLDDLDAVRFAPPDLRGSEEARHGPAVLDLIGRLER